MVIRTTAPDLQAPENVGEPVRAVGQSELVSSGVADHAEGKREALAESEPGAQETPLPTGSTPVAWQSLQGEDSDVGLC